MLRLAILVGLTGVLTPACAAPTPNSEASKSEPQAADRSGDKATTQSQKPSERFRNLDEYLAFLEKTQAPVDGAWYREVRPDVFVLQTGNLRVLGGGAAKQREFSRTELEREFGFSK
jgi:hypothetical protein